MKRHKHSLSHYRLSTFDMGKLVPIGCYEVLPGDTIQQSSSLLLRVTPQLAPVMHPINVRLHSWFVPYRILWPGWEDFITGVSNDPPPTFDTGTGVVNGSVLDHMGVPSDVPDLIINSFNLNAYNLIWNEFYRDQDLQTERDPTDNSLAPVAWEKDYFTTARPWEQKGPEITLPLGTTAPVVPESAGSWPDFLLDGAGAPGRLSTIAGDAQFPGTGGLTWNDPRLVADLSAASAVNVNEVRRAFALQRYQEARALYGSRYTEYLAYLGVRSSDARLQRPEYLGGGKSTISFSEVLKTGPEVATDEDPVGAMKGHGISAMRSRRWRKYFEEHGVVLTLCSVRPRAMYADALHRGWFRTTKEDYWQKELEFIGQQPIYGPEIYAGYSPPDFVFGYGDRYSEYRTHPSGVSGEFRNVLDYWHLARMFSAEPVLNADFIECDPGKRIFADQTQNSLWAMAGHSIQARRMVASVSVGRII